MGTRADFYIGRGEKAEWIGSIAWDGYPSGITPLSEGERHKSIEWPEGEHLFDAGTEPEFRERVARFFQFRADVTLPEDGWPWPWEDSNTTDYAYAFDEGKVWGNQFGHGWREAPNEPDDEEEGYEDQRSSVFPDMSERKNVKLGGAGSGLITITSR